MRTFVISLHENNDIRRKHIANEFIKHAINFEFFDAITPNKNKEICKENGLEYHSTNLSEKEISCSLSHYILWNKMIQEDIPFIAIFEDDIYLSKDIGNFLYDISWIPQDIHLIKLEKGWQDKIKASLISQNIHNRKLYRLQSEHLGTAGYILSNRGARLLIEKYKENENIYPIDVFIFRELLNDNSLNISQILPALCIQDFVLRKKQDLFPSELEKDRLYYSLQEKSPIHKKGLLSKVIREMIRPFKKAKNKFINKFLRKDVTFQ